jgi:hypothetical protein
MMTTTFGDEYKLRNTPSTPWILHHPPQQQIFSSGLEYQELSVDFIPIGWETNFCSCETTENIRAFLHSKIQILRLETYYSELNISNTPFRLLKFSNHFLDLFIFQSVNNKP